MKKRLEDKPKSKTAFEKAQSGLLLINSSDIGQLLSQNVNFLPKAPMRKKDDDGAEAFTQSFFKAGDWLSPKKKHDDYGTLFMAWMLMMKPLLPSFAPAPLEYQYEPH